MPSEQEMMADLATADAAGDSHLAQHIAGQIKALRVPQQQQEPSWTERLKYAAHKTAGLLPAAGGIAGGAVGGGLGGAVGFPTTGPGGIVTTAAGAGVGAGLGSAGGRALQHAIDASLGYEQDQGTAETIKDSAKTGARDGAITAAGGVIVPTLLTGAGRLAPALDSVGNRFGRRVLSGGATPLTVKKPLSDAAVEAAHEAGAFRPFGTTQSASQAVDAARDTVGEEYGQIVSKLESAGVKGPTVLPLASQYAGRAASAQANSLNPSVPRAYSSVASQLQRLIREPRFAPTPKPTDIPTGDDAALREIVSERAAIRYPSPPPPPVSAPPPAYAAKTPYDNKSFLAAINQRFSARSGPSEIPVGHQMNTIETSAQTPPPTASLNDSGTSFRRVVDDLAASRIRPPDATLGLTQAENMKRSLQGLARSAYKQQMPDEVAEAHMDAAAMLKSAVEKAIEKQAALAPDEAAAFVPVKQRLGPLIEASNAATRGAAMADRRSAFSLTDYLAAAAGAAHGHSPLESGGLMLANKALRTYGPSAATWASKGGADLLERLASLPAASTAQAGATAALGASEAPNENPLAQLADALRRRRLQSAIQ